jgi:hypothetical protein
VTAGRIQKKPALVESIKKLVRMLDRSLAKAAAYLRKVGGPIYNRMRCSHRDISKLTLSNATSIEPQRHTEQGSQRIQIVPAPRPSAWAVSGSMMAVSISSGAVTSYHYDEGDDAMLSQQSDEGF